MRSQWLVRIFCYARISVITCVSKDESIALVSRKVSIPKSLARIRLIAEQALSFSALSWQRPHAAHRHSGEITWITWTTIGKVSGFEQARFRDMSSRTPTVQTGRTLDTVEIIGSLSWRRWTHDHRPPPTRQQYILILSGAHDYSDILPHVSSMGYCHGQDLIIIPFHGKGGRRNREGFYSWAPIEGGTLDFIRLPRLYRIIVYREDDNDWMMGFYCRTSEAFMLLPSNFLYYCRPL